MILYDSAKTILPFDTEEIISKLIPTMKFQIKLDTMKMTKTLGSMQLMLIATSLAYQNSYFQAK